MFRFLDGISKRSYFLGKGSWTIVLVLGMLLSQLFGQLVQAKGNELAANSAHMSVYATGLNNPRGLKFGPDGNLYVAEGGTGGDNSTEGTCQQVPAPIGPYKGGMTARISKIGRDGKRTTMVDNLPSSQTAPTAGSWVSGVADVAFLKGKLYAILAGAGCSHGVPQLPNGIIQVNPNGTWRMIANLSAFQQANPVANPDEEDFEPDGTWYSLQAVGDALYAVEPNHGELDRITAKGKIKRVIDISASQKHIVPTSLAAYQGHFYIGNLTPFPLAQGGAKVLEINRGGNILSIRRGFTNIVGTAFGPDGNLYVLESTVGSPLPAPNMGQVVRVDSSGNTTVVASGLSLPTAMTFGPDGALYVSNKGFGYAPGMGEIVRIELGN